MKQSDDKRAHHFIENLNFNVLQRAEKLWQIYNLHLFKTCSGLHNKVRGTQ